MTAIPHSLEYADAHAHGHAHPELGFLKKYVFSVDHKIIGIQFLFMGLMFMVVGGLLAMLIRWQLAWPNDQTQGREHPVPILAKALWSTPGPLGPIASVDAAAKTVTLSGVEVWGIKPGEEATIKSSGQDVAAKILSVEKEKSGEKPAAKGYERGTVRL